MNPLKSEVRRKELIESIAKEHAVLRAIESKKLLTNLFEFNRKVLKVEDGPGRVPLADFHKELCSFVETWDKERRKLILIPRGHLKSSLVTVGYSLQQIAKNPKIRILIANATYQMAVAFLSQIKDHLVKNETFIEMYGSLGDNAAKWTESMIKIASDEESYERKEPTVTAYGIGGSLTSQHYDLIILDDLVNRENIGTKEQIEKVILSYKDCLDLLEPDGHLVMIGTRWHDADLYGWIKDNQGDYFESVTLKAVDGGLDSGKILFPAKYSRSYLQQLRAEKGPYEFCLPAESPVVMSDWTERPVQEIRVGDVVVGFERGVGVGKNKLVRSKVLRITSFEDDIYEVTMASGRSVRCNKHHRWYTGRLDKTHKMYRPARVGGKLMYVFPPEERLVPYCEEVLWSYLGGMFDADGSLKSGGCLNITQGIENQQVIGKIKRVLTALKIEYREEIRDRGVENPSWGEVSTIHLLGGSEFKLRFIRNCDFGKRPELIEQLYEKGSRFVKEKDTIVDIKKICRGTVYGLETETKNFIAYGYASSNSTQYMNDPIPDESATFRPDWFKHYDSDELYEKPVNYFTFVDPAISASEQADYTVILTIAVDQYRNVWVKDIFRDRVNPTQLINQIFLTYEEFRPRQIAIETVAFQKALQHFIYEEMRTRNVTLPLMEVKPDYRETKEMRIRGLVPYYEQGKIYHPSHEYNVEFLEDELKRFPVSKHDDIIDALSYFPRVIFPPKVKTEDEDRRRHKYLY